MTRLLRKWLEDQAKDREITAREYSFGGDRRAAGFAGMAIAYDEVMAEIFEKRTENSKEETQDHWVDPARRLSTRTSRR